MEGEEETKNMIVPKLSYGKVEKIGTKLNRSMLSERRGAPGPKPGPGPGPGAGASRSAVLEGCANEEIQVRVEKRDPCESLERGGKINP